jgi:hypothetical protein
VHSNFYQFFVLLSVFCIFRDGCPTKISVKSGFILKITEPDHNHGSQEAVIKLQMLENNKLEEAVQVASTPRAFATTVAYEISKEPALLPLASTPKAYMRRLERGKAARFSFPPPPKTIQDIVEAMPDMLKHTEDGRPFLQCGGYIEGSDTEASFLFVSGSGLDQLLHSQVWGIDGTFAVATDPIKQVLVITVSVQGE